MWKHIDRAFGWLLVIGGLLHGAGAFKTYDLHSAILVWSLSGSLAALLLAAINLMRVNRPNDRTLAYVACVGSLCWVGIALAFGMSINTLIDPRVLWHAVVAAGLAIFSAYSAWGRPSVT